MSAQTSILNTHKTRVFKINTLDLPGNPGGMPGGMKPGGAPVGGLGAAGSSLDEKVCAGGGGGRAYVTGAADTE
jgi:hypothetical protein